MRAVVLSFNRLARNSHRTFRFLSYFGGLRFVASQGASTDKCKVKEINILEKKKIWDKFSWIGDKVPCFGINGNNVTVLSEPSEFHEILKSRIKGAKKRVVIASLYLGTGKLEEQLVESIKTACIEAKENPDSEFEVNILLDFTRGSRGKDKSSRTLLLPLVKEFTGIVKVHLYHTPDLRGFLQKILPEKYNETIGLNHIKMYLFDDSFIISGANLSDSYFTNRQDRYILFDDCKEVADFFTDMVKTVSSFSFTLDSNNTVYMNETSNIHPYRENDNGNAFRYVAKKKILHLLQKYKSQNTTDFTIRSKEQVKGQNKIDNTRSWSINKKQLQREANLNETQLQREVILNRDNHSADPDDSQGYIDTWIFPLIQMGPFSICDDEVITRQIFELTDQNDKIFLASGYFNLTNDYMDTIVKKSKAKYDVLLASPEVNGFFGARFPLGMIPTSYIYIAEEFYKEVYDYNQQHRIVLREYFRDQWTFHAKGIWYYLDGNELPVMTLIGSSNFGYRSVYRDLECQIAMVTSNERLRKQLKQEHDRIYERSETVTEETFKREDRHIPLYIRLFTPFVKHFF